MNVTRSRSISRIFPAATSLSSASANRHTHGSGLWILIHGHTPTPPRFNSVVAQVRAAKGVASVGGALSFVMLPASYSVPQSGCATPLVPDGLMVSSTSAIYSKNPSPGSPRAGAFHFERRLRSALFFRYGASGLNHSCRNSAWSARRSSLDSRFHSFLSTVDQRLHVKQPFRRSPRLSISISGCLHLLQQVILSASMRHATSLW